MLLPQIPEARIATFAATVWIIHTIQTERKKRLLLRLSWRALDDVAASNPRMARANNTISGTADHRAGTDLNSNLERRHRGQGLLPIHAREVTVGLDEIDLIVC